MPFHVPNTCGPTGPQNFLPTGFDIAPPSVYQLNLSATALAGYLNVVPNPSLEGSGANYTQFFNTNPATLAARLTTDGYIGTNCYQLITNVGDGSSMEARTVNVAARQGQQLSVGAAGKIVQGAGTQIQLIVRWADSAGAALSTTVVTTVTPVANTWYWRGGQVNPPVNTAFASVGVKIPATEVGTINELRLDATLISPSTVPLQFFDGDNGGVWLGTPSASASLRAGLARRAIMSPLLGVLTPSATTTRSAGKNLAPTSTSSVTLPRQIASTFSATGTGSATLQRMTGKLLSVIATVVASVVTVFQSGGVINPLTLLTTQPQVASLVKRTARTFATTQAQVTLLTRRTAHTLSASQTQTATISTIVAHVITLLMTQPQVASFIRRTQHAATATSTGSATLAAAVARLLTLLVTQPQVAAVIRQIRHAALTTQSTLATLARLTSKRITATQTQAASLTSMLVHLITLLATATPVVTVIRSCRHVASVAGSAIASFTLQTRHNLSAAGTAAVTLPRSIAHKLPVTTVTATATLSAVRAFLITLLATVSQSTAISRSIRITRQLASAQSATAVRAIAHSLSAANGQNVTTLRQTRKTFSATAPATASLGRAFVRTLVLLATSAPTAFVQRAIAKIIPTTSQPIAFIQHAASIFGIRKGTVALSLSTSSNVLLATAARVASSIAVTTRNEAAQAVTAKGTASSLTSTGSTVTLDDE